MPVKKPAPNKAGKRFFTVAEANSTLPLVRVIVRDIADLARDLRERHERLSNVRATERGLPDAYQEEIQQVQAEVERDQARMQEFENELRALGIELKDYYTGLVDFPCLMDGREVYLCWRLGESEVAYWHELETGFAGRQKIKVNSSAN